MRKMIAVLLAAVMLTAAAGCEYMPFSDQTAAEGVWYDYYDPRYCYTAEVEAGSVTEELRQELLAFGEPDWIETAPPVVESCTDVPKAENDAKGTAPIHYLFPDRDMNDFVGPFILEENESVEISVYYRMVGELITDECVKLYVDPSGKIVQYDAINLGKYDRLEPEAERLAQARNRLEEEIMTAFDSGLRGETQCPVEGYRPITDTGHPYALFTDREGNLVLSIRVYMQGSKNPRLEWVPVLLYAVMSPEK